MRQRLSTGVFLAAAAAGCLLLLACASQPESVPSGLSVAELFQRAQDAADKRDFAFAIDCYSLVQKDHPEDIAHGAWASYEIAFLYHKMGKDETALGLLQQLLDRYAKEGASLPFAPLVLAKNLKARLEAPPRVPSAKDSAPG